MQELGAQYMSIFFQQPDGPDEYRRIEGEGNFTEEQWEKGQSHAVLLAAMYQSQLHRFPQLSQPQSSSPRRGRSRDSAGRHRDLS